MQSIVIKVVKITIHIRSYLEFGFKVWEDHYQCWFWLVTGPHSNSGTVGAAATEAEAIRDARSLIEDLST